MPPTTLPVATTPSARRLLTSAWTASASWQTTAQVSRVSLSSTLLVEALALVLALCCWSACPLTMARSPSLASLCTHHPRSVPACLQLYVRLALIVLKVVHENAFCGPAWSYCTHLAILNFDQTFGKQPPDRGDMNPASDLSGLESTCQSVQS